MGDGALTSSQGWALAPPHDRCAQGLIVSAFNDLDAGLALLLKLPSSCGGGWLAEVLKRAPVTSAVKPSAGGQSHIPSVAIAFTATGLRAMGLSDDCLATFSTPFSEGMRQVDRQRRLGDDHDGGIASGPDGVVWSGNAQDPWAGDRAAKDTRETVHVALLLYHRDDASVRSLAEQVEAVLPGFDVTVVRRISMKLRDQGGEIREHFGFVDGISQPIPFGEAIVAGGAPRPADRHHAVAAGDLLIGHLDANYEPAPGPVVSDRVHGADGLPQGHAPHGYRDLGLDGSYLVIRELLQDVGGFRRSMEEAAAAIGDDAELLAARVVGRTKEGALLRPDGVFKSHGDGPANAFNYFKHDALGLGCPIGSHIRRANPRDGLTPFGHERRLFLHASNRHRILRRGRKFGPPYKEGEEPKVERGLLFMAINTDIARQFEFIQQTWMLNPNFGRLYNEIDPLVGRQGSFTVPADPVGSRLDVRTYIHLAGGDYFFLPSLPALRFLEQLR